jgi:hypothetical protein
MRALSLPLRAGAQRLKAGKVPLKIEEILMKNAMRLPKQQAFAHQAVINAWIWFSTLSC